MLNLFQHLELDRKYFEILKQVQDDTSGGFRIRVFNRNFNRNHCPHCLSSHGSLVSIHDLEMAGLRLAFDFHSGPELVERESRDLVLKIVSRFLFSSFSQE